MTIRSLHTPNSGEIELENEIYKTVLTNFKDLDPDAIMVAGTKLYFPTHSDGQITSKVLQLLHKYGSNITVLDGKPFLEVRRPKTYPLWQKGAFKIYTGVSLILSLVYFLPLLQLYLSR